MVNRIHRPGIVAPAGFFVGMAVALIAIAFIGFAPTFFLKAFFDTPDLPWYLAAHGAMLSAWFGLFLIQTVLVRTGRIAIHRKIGLYVPYAGAFVVLTTLVLILAAQSIGEARGITRQNPIEVLVLGDLAALTAFASFLFVGLKARHNTAVHSRAMLLAAIALVIPAITRLARFSFFGDLGPPLIPAFLAAPVLALWLHDWIKDGHIHRVSLWGGILMFAGIMASFGVAHTEVGRAIVSAISFRGL